MQMKFGFLVLSAVLILAAGSGALAKGKVKKGYDQARKECLEQNKELRGKKLQLCIKKKRSE